MQSIKELLNYERLHKRAFSLHLLNCTRRISSNTFKTKMDNCQGYPSKWGREYLGFWSRLQIASLIRWTQTFALEFHQNEDTVYKKILCVFLNLDQRLRSRIRWTLKAPTIITTVEVTFFIYEEGRSGQHH